MRVTQSPSRALAVHVSKVPVAAAAMEGLGTPLVLDTGRPVCAAEFCPFAPGARLLAVGATDGISLLSAGVEGADAALRPTAALQCPGVTVQAIAWGKDSTPELRLVAAGPRALSVHALGAHGESSRQVAQLPAEHGGGDIFACSFLAGRTDRVAVTGDECQCHILQLPTDASPCAAVRSLALRSEGVAVRTCEREPEQLMVAEGAGSVHFVDLRANDARPSLSRTLPATFRRDAGGLRDADWSPHDPYLVGGVCADQWVCWDLRFQGANPLPYAGDAQFEGASVFRWAPDSLRFAVAGSSDELLVTAVGPSAGAQGSLRARHGLPACIGGVSWLHHCEGAHVAGTCDTKVCVWSLS